MRLFKQLVGVFAALGVVVTILVVFSYDIIKLDWIVFMEIQESYRPMEHPLAVPAQSIPIEGPAYISSLGSPLNPVEADQTSITRGAELFNINCKMCHGEQGKGNGSIAPFLVDFKPADLTSDVIKTKSDGSLFLTISNGVDGRMPALNENLTVRERWDVVNYIRILQAAQ